MNTETQIRVDCSSLTDSMSTNSRNVVDDTWEMFRALVYLYLVLFVLYEMYVWHIEVYSVLVVWYVTCGVSFKN